MKTILCILAVGMASMVMQGCAHSTETIRAPSVGKCWTWEKIEKEFVESTWENTCHETKTIQDESFRCCRRKGHKGKHHSHSFRDCWAVW